MREAAKYIDYILYDIKTMDEETHFRYTGCGNKLILRNLEMLFAEYPLLHKHIRTPVIPGVNDTEQDLSAIQKFLTNRKNCTYEQLPYHRFGERKYELLGRTAPEF